MNLWNWLIGKDFPGAAFVPYTLPHYLMLAAWAIIILLILQWGKHTSLTARRRFRIAYAILMSVDYLAWNLWTLLAGSWDVHEMLPLHFCTITGIIGIAALFTGKQRLYEVSYLLSISGALATLSSPDVGLYGPPHYLFFQIFFSHCSMILAALWMTIVEGYRPYPSSLLRVTLYAAFYLPIVYLINRWLGANYIFLASKPPFASPLDYLGPYPWYILSMVAIGLALAGLFYLPFLLRDLRKQKILSEIS
jgi:hypothetical integral membrane protein (TIGR02206 family)